MSKDQVILDVTEKDFDAVVLKAPPDKAVVVDFWAEWCQPCRALGPVLERMVESFGGRALLARVNVDENRGLMSRFPIQGIPAVMAFRGGKQVSQFVGLLPEDQIRQFLEGVVPSEADDLVAEGDGLAGEGKAELAEASYRKALHVRPNHGGAAIRLARMAIQRGELDEARRCASIAESSGDSEEAQAILLRADYAEACQSKGGRETCEKNLAENPDDAQSRFDAACCRIAQCDYREALDCLLGILERDKSWEDGKAKDAMVDVFRIVGQRDPLADEYRTKLANLLY